MIDLLLVDDDDSLRKLSAMMINMYFPHTFQVHQASDGEQALDFIKQRLSNPPDFTLMDVQMPKMYGTEAAKEMRKFGYNNPILLWSGSPDYHGKKIVLDSNIKIINKMDYIGDNFKKLFFDFYTSF